MKNFIPIKGYEGYYAINPSGEVLSSFYGIILKHGMSAGYPRVSLYKPGKKRAKNYHIHRLLAEHFIPNPMNLPQVNHKDGNRENFSIENLEWCTASENIKHSYKELGRSNGWGTSRPKVDRRKTCEYCEQEFLYKRRTDRFCDYSCSAKWRVINHPHTVSRNRNSKGVFVC